MTELNNQQNQQLNQARLLLNNVTNTEKLLLTQAVCQLGASNWNLISSLLSNNSNLELNSAGLPSNTASKFTSQFCAFVFSSLMHTEGFTDLSQAALPNSRPGKVLAHKYYTARVQELVGSLVQGKRDEQLLQADILEITSGAADDRILSSIPPAIREQILQQRQVQAEQQALQQQQQQQYQQQQQQQSQQSQALHQQQQQSHGLNSSTSAIASGSGTQINRIHPAGTPIPTIPAPTASNSTKKATTRVSRSSAIPIVSKESNSGERNSTSDNETGTEDDENENTIEVVGQDGKLESNDKPTSTVTILNGKKSKAPPKPRKSLRGKANEQVSEAEPEVDEEGTGGEENDEVMEMKEETEGEEGGRSGEENTIVNTRKGKNSKAAIASMVAAKRKSKRKTSEPVDSSPPPEAKESKGKKPRLETEEIEEGTGSVSGQPVTLTEKESKAAIARFKRSINALLDRLSDLPDAHHFKSPVPRSIAPNYNLAIKKPMCIRDVARRVKEGVLTTSEEVIRDVALIFANAVQYNGLVVKEGEVAMGIQAQGVWEEFERMMEIQLNLEARNSTT